MVIVDVRIAVAGHIQIDHPVARDLIHHMFKEGNTSVKHTFTGTIQIEADADFGFQGVSGDLGNTVGHRNARS